MKAFFEHNMEMRLRKLKNSYDDKLREMVRSGQN